MTRMKDMPIWDLDWIDIKSAPKDGTLILCCHASGHINILKYLCFFDDETLNKWSRWNYRDYHDWKPTHWIPLPEPIVSK